MKVWVLNGPNLGRLDLRDHSIYGDISFKDLVEFCVAKGKELGLQVEVIVKPRLFIGYMRPRTSKFLLHLIQLPSHIIHMQSEMLWRC